MSVKKVVISRLIWSKLSTNCPGMGQINIVMVIVVNIKDHEDLFLLTTLPTNI